MEAAFVRSKKTKRFGVASFGYPWSEFWFVKFEGDRAGRWVNCMTVKIVEEERRAA